MNSRVLSRAGAAAARCITPAFTLARSNTPRRSFQTSARFLQDTAAAAAVPKRPVGAFRGGLFGFLLGATSAGAGMYYYVLEEYRVSNELLTEDIYNLQATVQRVESYIKVLEDKVQDMAKRKS